MAAMMIVGIMAITTFGCSSNNNNSTPYQTVNELFQLTQERNCHAIADLVTDTYPELADRYVKDCPQVADSLVSYSIGQTTYVTGVSAVVDVDVTIKENGKEKTNSVTQFLVKRGDEWKLTETENRSSKPPSY
ncbi:MAG: hypothetical protein ACYCXU_08595 [Thermoleophilia bacterium]